MTRWISLLLAGVLAAVVLTGCTKEAEGDPAAAKPEGTMNSAEGTMKEKTPGAAESGTEGN
jgi:outer membrane murein-binding lipoprotein Lpp